MLLRIPDYYKKFKCIADQCRDSCCIGWEIDIDEDTYEYYKSIEGPFGERLRANMAEGEENTFVLKDGRCPFLNGRNLCDICIELGEEALSHVCTEYPRFVTEYGEVTEKCLALSCEVVGKLVFEREEPFRYEEIRQADFFEADSEEDNWAEGEEDEPDEEDGETADPVMISLMERARDQVIAVMQMRSLTVEQRLRAALEFGWQVQEAINCADWNGLEEVLNRWKRQENWKIPEGKHGGSAGEEFLRRMDFFEGMEVLDEEWQKARDHVRLEISGRTSKEYEAELRAFRKYYEATGRIYEYEHLCVYFLFRYCMQSVYDCSFYTHVAAAAASFLMIRDMDLVRFLDNGRRFSLEDRIDVARIYSKEVEHSEENLEYLAEAFCYEEVFERERLIAQIGSNPAACGFRLSHE